MSAADPLPPGVPADLARPEAYPHDPSAHAGVRWVQTHISHVFLTGARVYKLRKPVSLGFVDFSQRAERTADCVREVALNRRLAPDVYLGLAAIETNGHGARVGPLREEPVGGEPPPEHCVVMRRLPDGRDALSLLRAGRLRRGHLDRVAATIARFHDEHGLGVPAPFSREAWLARIWAPVAETLEALADHPAERLRLRVAAAARARFEALEPAFEARRREGRAVDGHGDLHLQHVWFERDDGPPLVIDCLEFREDLRRIDSAADVAFLAMDLEYRRRRGFAERFLRRVARDRDDFGMYAVVDFFVAYRAAVRAKVAAIAAADPEIPAEQRTAASESATAHLRLAARALARRSRAAVVVTTGLVGTGKSTVAEALADALDAVVISSDRVRKRLAGLPPDARAGAGPDRGLYAETARKQVYEAMLERARPVLASGRPVILDATFDRAERRAAARALARELGVPFRVVETRCQEAVALARLARREAEGHDPSDAGPALYPVLAARYEPVRELPPGEHEEVRTDRPGWRRRVREIARRLRRRSGAGRAAGATSSREEEPWDPAGSPTT